MPLDFLTLLEEALQTIPCGEDLSRTLCHPSGDAGTLQLKLEDGRTYSIHFSRID